VLPIERGEALQDLLFTNGVEFPCGGRGRCKGCRIKLLSGTLPITHDDISRLTTAELSQGWRLACRATAESDLKIELAQWESPILSDDSPFKFEPREGLGVAVDLGTTTIVAQLLDLRTGQVLGVSTALNVQAKHGADVMSRIEFALLDQGQLTLKKLIRDQIVQLILELLNSFRTVSTGTSPKGLARERITQNVSADAKLESVVLVGNTVMHHLFGGISVEPLSHYPFESPSPDLQIFSSSDLGWSLPENPKVYFLPCLGGFVGSDILAGILATGLHERDSAAILIDLGTNGEIVVGNRDRLLCAATAAGPAFEGARISMGMRAATGAISRVDVVDGQIRCHVLGNTSPRGICGSGLVDAAAAGLDLGWLLPNGRLAGNQPVVLAPPVTISQWDIRELQLAKGAIAAGVRLLLENWGPIPEQGIQVFLAGAFGNYINHGNAHRIGLLRFPLESIRAVGNTALLGAKMALFSLPQQDLTYGGILRNVRHISLNELPGFQEAYVEEMALG
jgi:uncharacterized 2Fe-2S/4Fe-4S cluster protein (DUF4445 family)